MKLRNNCRRMENRYCLHEASQQIAGHMGNRALEITKIYYAQDIFSLVSRSISMVYKLRFGWFLSTIGPPWLSKEIRTAPFVVFLQFLAYLILLDLQLINFPRAGTISWEAPSRFPQFLQPCLWNHRQKNWNPKFSFSATRRLAASFQGLDSYVAQ